MVNILYAHSVNVVGGAERVTMDMVSGLAEKYSISVICPGGNLNRHLSGFLEHHIDCDFVQPDWKHPLRTMSSQLILRNKLKLLKPNIIHCGDILAIRFIKSVAESLKIPLICHVHYPYDFPFINWALRNTSVSDFIYCSDELFKAIGSELKKQCPTARHHVVHNGVDTNRFAPSEVSKKQEIQIGIIGNLQERKGHIDFIDMASIVIKEGYSSKFHVIGGDILGEKRTEILKNYVNELDITEHFVFHGQVDDVHQIIENIDIVVCASHTEAFPLTILEAMASQKAIVTTNVNGIPEATGRDGECALLAPPHSPTVLAQHCIDLILNPSKRTLLAKRARERVKLNFSKEIFINKICNIYNNLL